MIQLADIVRQLQVEVFCGETELERPVCGGYCGDLLSDVMAHANGGEIWITIQTHPNIIAVASLKELSGVLIANGRKPLPETLEKARGERMPVLGCTLPAYALAVRLDRLIVASESPTETGAGGSARP